MSLEVVSTIFWCHRLCVTATAVVLLLLLLSYYCCFHITLVTSAFPGAAELTTQLLRLISILCLPLCRINKFGFYFPRRLLRSPILVGHQAYVWVLGWEARPRLRIYNPTHERSVFYFWGAEIVFFKQLQGGQFSIARNLCRVIGDRLLTTYDIPCARVSFLGILAASCGVPPNPLETNRI